MAKAPSNGVLGVLNAKGTRLQKALHYTHLHSTWNTVFVVVITIFLKT